jgi:hypothetical protein
MTNRVQLRRSSTPGYTPSVAEMLLGELGLNLVDKKLFANTGTEVFTINAAANISTDSTHRFVTDAQISSWTAGYTLPIASASVLGGVKVGANIDVDAAGVISLKVASATDTGLLSSADFATFVAKQDAIGYVPVNQAGDTMQGPLVLAGVPTVTNGAATKGYVDAAASGLVSKSGDTMSGLLVLSADPAQALGAATKQYVDNSIGIMAGEYAAPVQAIADLTAIAIATLQDKQMRLVEDEGAIFRFDAQSTIATDGTDVVEPADAGAAGRWIKVQAATQSHESLKNLQGGAAGDHLHLTTAEKNGYDAHLADYALHLTSAQNTWLDAVNASAAEVNYLVGVTSSIQSQLDGKQAALGYTAVNKAGDTMLGALYMSQDPVGAMEAVTLQFLQSYTIDGGVF